MTGKALCESETVRKLSFTGSTAVGAILLEQCAPTIKKVSMELGGNAAFIVFEDADVDAAVEGAMAAKFRNTGQTWVCVNRFLVHDTIYDRFSEQLVESIKTLKVGPGMDASSQQGPLIHDKALAKLEAHIADALANGAQIRAGGARHALGGTYFEPAVMVDVTSSCQVFSEETCGPLAEFVRFCDEDEAISLANRSRFGLAAYFYSSNVAWILRVSSKLEAGMIEINTGVISTAVAPFGGIKASGMGREGSLHGIDDYCEIQYLCLAGLSSRCSIQRSYIKLKMVLRGLIR